MEWQPGRTGGDRPVPVTRVEEGIEPESDEKPSEELGFGSRVRTGRGERLLHRDGSFGVRRSGLPLRAVISLYHTLLVMRWPAFLGLVGVSYVALNAAFALVYTMLGDGAVEGPGEPGFLRSFFFSVQTFSTIGYGHLIPMSVATNWVATLEAFVGLLCVALITGISFARFSRPMADIVFSRRALIAPYHGMTSFQFRIANQRRNQIIEPFVRVFLSMVELTADGARRQFVELPLERDRLAFFPLSWTVVHPIDEESPLFGKTEEDLEACAVEFIITINGLDETFSQLVHARSSYTADEIAWNRHFADIYERSEAGTPRSIDLARIHDVE